MFDAELSEEVEGLPLALHSMFPDISVDFLYSVFEEDIAKEIPLLGVEESKTIESEYKDASTKRIEAVTNSMPTDEELRTAQSHVEDVRKEIETLDSLFMPPQKILQDLRQLRKLEKDGHSYLVRCKLCGCIMYNVSAHNHVSLCAEISRQREILESQNTNGKNYEDEDDFEEFRCEASRRHPSSSSLRAAKKHKISTKTKKIATKVREKSIEVNEPPLSPILAAAAASRQARSLSRRQQERRQPFSGGFNGTGGRNKNKEEEENINESKQNVQDSKCSMPGNVEDAGKEDLETKESVRGMDVRHVFEPLAGIPPVTRVNLPLQRPHHYHQIPGHNPFVLHPSLYQHQVNAFANQRIAMDVMQRLNAMRNPHLHGTVPVGIIGNHSNVMAAMAGRLPQQNGLQTQQPGQNLFHYGFGIGPFAYQTGQFNTTQASHGPNRPTTVSRDMTSIDASYFLSMQDSQGKNNNSFPNKK